MPQPAPDCVRYYSEVPRGSLPIQARMQGFDKDDGGAQQTCTTTSGKDPCVLVALGKATRSW